MKVVAWLVGVATLVMALVYTGLSLYRWEWNRALFFAVVALGAEVILASAVILRKLTSLRSELGEVSNTRRLLRDNRPPHPKRFQWLEESVKRTNVFITFMVGGGLLLSGAAWVLDRVASASSGAGVEKGLAEDLQRITYPAGGLLPDEVTALAQSVPGVDDEYLRSLLRRSPADFR